MSSLPVFALHGHPQYAGHTRDAVIGEADDQSQIAAVLIAPDEGRPHAIADAAIDAVECSWISLVVVHQIRCADLVKIPERPVIGADIDDMSDHVFCRRDSFMRGTWVGRFARKSLLEQCGDPRRAIAEGFDLLVLDKDGVAANPVVAADRAVKQF